MFSEHNHRGSILVLYNSKTFEKLTGMENRSENPYENTGRNELCPCGSGKKYKNCCLK